VPEVNRPTKEERKGTKRRGDGGTG